MSVITPEEMPAFEGKGAPVQCSVAVGEQSVAKYNEAASNRVRVVCAVIRLPEETTDILVAVNTPIEVHPESTSAHAAEAPQRALQTQSREKAGSTGGVLGVIVAIATLQLATKSIFSRDTASVGDRFSVRAVGIPAMSLLENTVLSTQSHKPQKAGGLKTNKFTTNTRTGTSPAAGTANLDDRGGPRPLTGSPAADLQQGHQSGLVGPSGKLMND